VGNYFTVLSESLGKFAKVQIRKFRLRTRASHDEEIGLFAHGFTRRLKISIHSASARNLGGRAARRLTARDALF